MLIVIIYSFLQGLTEFIPVSSQGHLIVFNNFYSVEYFTGLSILQLNILAHFGSLFAIVIYYFKVLLDLAKSVFFIVRPDIDRNANILLNLIISSIPIFFVGYYFAKYFNINNDLILLVISLSSIIFGIVLYFIDKFCLRIKSLNALSYSTSFLIGIFQCFALVPGVSRSGAVISVMRFFGFQRQFSVFYSNLLSIPAIVAATSYLIIISETKFSNVLILNLQSYLIFILSFVFSLTFIYFFVSWIKNFSFFIFAFYRVVFGFWIIYLILPRLL